MTDQISAKSMNNEITQTFSDNDRNAYAHFEASQNFFRAVKSVFRNMRFLLPIGNVKNG